ncbi:MAG: long-chain fatty acid--CoA ligase, partial [Thermoleophilaceae bacterium]
MEPLAAPERAAARPRALQAATMCEAFQATAAEAAQLPALRLKDTDYECSWGEFAETVKRRAAGFAALGVSRGDIVGFMLVNRP